MAGMEVWNEKGNVYEFSVAEIKQKDAMIKAAEAEGQLALKKPVSFQFE